MSILDFFRKKKKGPAGETAEETPEKSPEPKTAAAGAPAAGAPGEKTPGPAAGAPAAGTMGAQAEKAPGAEKAQAAGAPAAGAAGGGFDSLGLRELFAMMERDFPSLRFASEELFRSVSRERESFAQSVRACDVMGAHRAFVRYYLAYCQKLGVRGTGDTDPRRWNSDIVSLRPGEPAALCYMPVEDGAHAAEIVGVVIGQRGDGSYFCALKQDESEPSPVMRNEDQRTVRKVGEVRGRGFELMNAFVTCIRNDYYAD
ncbi:MAG: hypothetical protein IK095_09365 [Oscillospiraceae bacterium]|nr:hypothetical protein [Oscillospiraceae bacterium]